ncbi:nucleotide-binding alpha-beta plait domain-containing protein [Tanacetum coccineum]
MVNFRSKEDDVARISTSVYISNIPDSINAKDLFQACKQYGHVVDSFIPIKRDKYGKRFGFVRFINVFNTERLVNNLCTVWIDRYKIQANIAHFQRSHGKGPKADVTNSYAQNIPNVKTKVNTFSKGDKSFAGVVKGRDISSGGDMKSDPVLVLGDECLGSKDLSLTLFGRVKEFASLANLKVAIGNEGFSEIVIKYMGELWVMLEFQSTDSLNKFRECVSIASWFSQIINASIDFEIEGRIAWVEVEGVPFKLWSGNTFRRIANKWGELLDVDDQDDNCYHSKRICIHMKFDRSIKDEFNIMHKGKKYWIRVNESPGWVPDFTDDLDVEDQEDMESNPEDIDNQVSGNCDNGLNDSGLDNDSDMEEVPETCFEDGKLMNNKDDGDNYPPKTELSEDPFKIYPLLNKHKSEDGSINKMGDSLKYPPGFTPMDEKDKISHNEGEKHSHNNVDVTSAPRENMNVEVIANQNSLKNKERGNESMASGHFKQSECPKTGGSILSLLEEVVKVGQVMGYRMEGCMANMEEIIGVKGVEDTFK